MNLDWPAVPRRDDLSIDLLEGEVLEKALRQMIDIKSRQMFDKPKDITVGDVKAFDTIAKWIEELSCGK
jgi:hypothetical protein